VIELTANAAAQIRVIVEEKGLDAKTSGLRLSVERGGCAGLQYAMSIGAPQENDFVVERGDAQLFIDAASLKWLDDSVIDYEEGLSGAGFRVNNPASARSCGCGTSFEPTGNGHS
jgi:iron-sulfur cluster assembly protein